MLIHELTLKQTPQINEGLLDRAKQMGMAAGDIANKAATKLEPHLQRAGDYAGNVARSSAPARMAQSAKQTVANIGQGKGTTMSQEYKVQEVASKAQAAWNGFVAKFAGSLDDPQEKEQYLSGADGVMEDQLTEFVERNLLGNKRIESFANAQKIHSLIAQICGGEAGALTEPRPSQQAQPTAKQPQAPEQSKKIVRHMSPAGTRVTSGEPRTLRFRGVEYIRDDEGDWTNFKTGKKVPQAQQAFLDKEDDYFDSLTEAAANDSQRKLFVDLIRQTSLATPARKRASAAQPRTAAYNDESTVDSTGNPKADAILKAAGFKVV